MIGECGGRSADKARALGWGRMWIARDRNIYTYPGEPWGLDNGAFRDWKDGVPFDGDLFLRVIEKAKAHPEPYLAVVPDAPGNGERTVEMAWEWLPELPAWPWYIAVQDGMVPDDLGPLLAASAAGVVAEIDGIFLGGTNAYKATAAMWCEWAHVNGLRFHFGRCGTLGKLELAREVGADSIDSALIMWTTERWDRFVYHFTHDPQTRMEL